MAIFDFDVFSWRPRRNSLKWKTEYVNSVTESVIEDVSSRTEDSSFDWPDTAVAIGAWELVLTNANGIKTGAYVAGNNIRFSGDPTNGTTKQYEGRIDKVVEIFEPGGRRLKLTGRHLGYVIAETPIHLQQSSSEASVVYQNIVSQLPAGHGFATTGIETIGVNVNVNWQTKFGDSCIQDLHGQTDASGYIDADKVINFFPANSRIRTNDAAVVGNTMIGIPEFGKDTYVNRDKVRVVGSTSGGLPVVATAGSGNRVKVIFDANIKTYEEAKNLAEAKLEVLQQEVLQGLVLCRGLPYVKPGENMWVVSPRTGIFGLFKVIRLRHKVGRIRGWQTEVVFEYPQLSIGQYLRDGFQKEEDLAKITNKSGLDKSFNLTFDDYTGLDSYANLAVENGHLVFAGSSVSSGTLITNTRSETDDMTRFELQTILGENRLSCIVYASTDNGQNYTRLMEGSVTTVPAGKSIKLKIDAVRDGETTLKIDEVTVLYGP